MKEEERLLIKYCKKTYIPMSIKEEVKDTLRFSILLIELSST